jgi:hypothetical protein
LFSKTFDIINFTGKVMTVNSTQHINQQPEELGLEIVRILFIISLLIVQASCGHAQNKGEGRETYDVFQFYMPEGFKPAYDASTLALNSDPAVSLCSFVFTGTLSGDDDPEKNFEDAWNALIVPALAGGSTERRTWKDDRDNWKGFAGSTVASFDTLKLQCDLHTYTKDGKYACAMFFFQPDKCEADHKLFLQYLGLAGDASENGPPSRDYYVTREPGFLSRDTLTGVWTLLQDDSTGYFRYIEKENFITFMDNGDVYNALIPYGSFHVDREELQKDDAMKNKWGKYEITGTLGTMTTPSEPGPVSLAVLNDTLIYAGEYQFVRCKSVSNYRLEGVWETDFSGVSNKLTLNLADRFTDTGIFKSLHNVDPWLFADEEGGEGNYQIYDHTIYFEYDDGRTRSLSFVNPGYFDLRETNALLLIAGKPFKKIPGENVTY